MRTHYLSCETAETQGNHACVKFLGGNINYLTDEELASSLGSAFIDINFLIWSISLALYSGFRRKARVLKCRLFFGAKREVIVSGVPCVNRGNWGWESSNLCYHVLALRKRHLFTECGVLWSLLCKDSCLIRSSHIQMHTLFVVGPH